MTTHLLTENGCSISSGTFQSHLQDLRKRISALEGKVYNPLDSSIEIDEQIRRARHAVEFTYRCYSAQWKWVPSDYYSLPLSSRAKILNACNVQQLCKSILMENKKFLVDEVAKGNASRAYSRFYLVVVQYTSAINTKKLELAIRKLRKVGEGRLPVNYFEFSVAREEDSERLTGYSHNAVTPFGLLDSSIPIVIPSSLVYELAETPFVWMGGGHVHLKLGLSIDEFVRKTNAIVADISDPRAE